MWWWCWGNVCDDRDGVRGRCVVVLVVVGEGVYGVGVGGGGCGGGCVVLVMYEQQELSVLIT